MDFGIAGVAGITVLCYLVGLLIKATPLDNKWIPVVVGITGGALGILGLYIMPDFPAGELISAAAVGVVSGLASTGANEAVKHIREE